MKAVTRRLLRLEASFGRIASAAHAEAVPSGAAVIAENLARMGIVREGDESLAETTARSMGVTMAELRNQLWAMANRGL